MENLNDYYYIKNLKTKEIEVIPSWQFHSRFAGKFEYLLTMFFIKYHKEHNEYADYNQHSESLFFQDFVCNFNKCKQEKYRMDYYKYFENLEAVTWDSLSQTEQESVLLEIQKQEKHTDERRNQTTKSVGNGEGSLYKSEKLNCWIYQYYDTRNKRQTLKQRKNESVKDFKIRVTNVKNSLNNGTYTPKSTESIVSLAEHYIEQKHNNKITSDRSYKRDLETLEQLKHTCFSFCNLPIQSVTIDHIENAYNEITQYSNSVIDKIWRLLNKSFKIACSPSRKILIYNVFDDETLSKPTSVKPTKKIKPITDKECKKLLHILDNEEKNHKYRNIVKMQIISGMRIGEVVARSIDDYNKTDKTFNVHNTLTQDKDYKTIWSEHTKTYNKKTQIDEGQRFLPLDTPLFAGLLGIIEDELENKIISIKNTHNVLFWDYKNDTFISTSEVDSWLNRLNEKYHICHERLSSHRLRHTTITAWRNKGVPLDAIQYFAGHVDGSDITKRVYIDTSFDYAKDVISKMS